MTARPLSQAATLSGLLAGGLNVKCTFETQRRIGRVLTGMTTALVLMSATGNIAGMPKMIEGLTHAGIPRTAIVPLALLELTCLALYLLPRSGVLGTLLLTGYFGGAIATDMIGGSNVLPPLIIGVLACAGSYLRFAELREVLPWRRGENAPRIAGEARKNYA